MTRSLLLLTLLFCTPAFAEIPAWTIPSNVKLFTLMKPKNPENLVQTFVPVSPGCQLGKLDFWWVMGGVSPRTPADVMRCNILNRIVTVPSDPSRVSSCEKSAHGRPCSQLFVMPTELSQMGFTTPLVIRAIKQANGTCDVGAYVDAGGRSVKISRINVNGAMKSESLTGGTVLFSGLDIIADDGSKAVAFKCTKDCLQSASGSLFCHLNQ